MSILRKDVNKLLIEIKKGEEKSKSVLFEKTYNHLKRIAYPYVRNKNDVEDVLIEAYLRIFQYINNFETAKDGYNWMCKIVQNVSYDFNKKYKEEVPLDELDKQGRNVDIEEKIVIDDEIQRFLEKYPERDRKIIELRFFEDKTIEEIAALLKMGKSNVHKRISKILKETSQKTNKKVEK